MLNPEKVYHRKKDILYDESGAAIVKFIGNTNNAEKLTGNLVENMNNYIRCYPERVEVIESKKGTNAQIYLF